MVLKNPEATRRLTQIKVLFSKRSLPKWRVFSLVFVHLLFAVHFLHWKMSGRTLAPFEFSESLYTLHSGILTLGFIFMAAAIAGTLCFGRFFCGWGCHILALQDSAAWILSKFGVKPKPIRSRAMLWVPFATFAFMFLWPQAVRIFMNEPRPPFVIQSEMQGWSSFMTTDLLRAMPGLAFTLITFAVCGYLIVYFLGSRSFCSSVCPYGVFFGWTDRIAPNPKIILSGGCENCGLCTQNCKSGVNVIQEIRRYGAVVDKNCMKSMDCVAGCPKEALSIGFTKPSFLLEKGKPKRARKYDFTVSEEVLFAVVFVPLVMTYYGLYSRVGILLGVTIAVIGGFCAIRVKRMLAMPRRRWLPMAAAAAFAFFSLHSAFVHYHAYMGARLFMRHFQAAPAEPRPGEAERDGLARAAASLATAHAWGFLKPAGHEKQAALAYARLGEAARAEEWFLRYLTAHRDDAYARVHYGNLLANTGRGDGAFAQYQAAIAPTVRSTSDEDKAWRATAHSMSARFLAGKGDTSRALYHLRAAISENPNDISGYCNLSLLSLKAGDRETTAAAIDRGLQRFGLSDCLEVVSGMLNASR